MLKKDKAMCAIEKQYHRFWRMMEDAEALKGENVDFRAICRRLHCSPADLDEVLESELGTGGDEVVEVYFGNGRIFY